jgi:hypothetical protein
VTEPVTDAPAVRLRAVVHDAHDPEREARFWAGLLDREAEPDRYGEWWVRGPGGEPDLRFDPSPSQRTGLHRYHWHVTSTSDADQQHHVERALELGGSHLDVGQLPEEDHVVLADPEGYELCVIEAGNGFLAGTGVLGELSGDGTADVGHFWSTVLGWPLVWDQGGETAIQAPVGGTKLSWGGGPVAPKREPGRIRLEVTPVSREVDNMQGAMRALLAAGAHDVRATGHGEWVLQDPSDNELVLTPAG